MNKVTKKDLYKIAYKGSSWFIVAILITTVLTTAMGVITPIITNELIDKSIPDKDMSKIIFLIVSMFGLLLLKMLSSFILSYIGRILQTNVEWNVRKHAFGHMQKINVPYYDRKNEGHFITRVNEDSNNIAQLIRYLPENILSGLILSVSAFTVSFMFDWVIGTVLVAIFLVLIIFTFTLRRGFRLRRREIKKHVELVSMTLVNSISGVKESKINLAEDREEAKFNAFLDALHKTWRKMFKLMGSWISFNTFMLLSVTIIILTIGTIRHLAGAMSIGQITASMMYAGQISEPVNKFTSSYDVITSAQTSIARVLEFLNVPEERYGMGIEFDRKVTGEIEFKNVSFDYEIIDEEFLSQSEDWNKYRYDKNKMIETKAPTYKTAIKNVSFKIKAGQKVAFVGETGSGKSTIFKLLLRFYERTSGQILMDGIDANELKIEQVRKQMSYMQQDPYMFFDTIKNNLLFAFDNLENKSNENIDAIINDALEISNSSKFISELPNKLEQNIGPRGINLSGGQKQRIAIARAIIKDAPILLFDEATSALDNETEKEIQKALEKISKDKTVIFIAHRLSTIHDLDNIFVMKKGELVESGTHDELMKQKGYYYSLNKIVE